MNRIHEYVRDCQGRFLEMLETLNLAYLSKSNLLYRDLSHHGHFLTFKLKDANHADDIHRYLKKNGVITDCRGDRLRFGFAIYHNPEEYDLSCLKNYRLG